MEEVLSQAAAMGSHLWQAERTLSEAAAPSKVEAPCLDGKHAR